MSDLTLRIWCAKCNRMVADLQAVRDNFHKQVEITAACHGNRETHAYDTGFLAKHTTEINAQIGIAFEDDATYANT